MTILPKKKPVKDKDGETSELSPHSPPTVEVSNRAINTRSRPGTTSPTRWLQRQNETPYDDYENHPTTSHNKRRHRSSPHRTVRKHRGECHNIGHRERERTHRDRTHSTNSTTHKLNVDNVLPHSPELDNLLGHVPPVSSPHRDIKLDSELPAIEESGNNSEDEYNTILPTQFNFPGCEKARNFDEVSISSQGTYIYIYSYRHTRQ